jgi:hypothetical protein
MLVIIYWALDLSQGHLRAVGPRREARPVVGLFKWYWLNLGASLTGSCRVRTGGLRMSMRFMGPEEGGLLQFQGLPGPVL